MGGGRAIPQEQLERLPLYWAHYHKGKTTAAYALERALYDLHFGHDPTTPSPFPIFRPMYGLGNIDDLCAPQHAAVIERIAARVLPKPD
jgi:hypothetical protein